jgi:hypothetical protein
MHHSRERDVTISEREVSVSTARFHARISRRGVSPQEGTGTAAETHARAEAKKAAAARRLHPVLRSRVQSVGGLVVPPAVSYRARRSGHMAKTLFIITCFSLSAWMA